MKREYPKGPVWILNRNHAARCLGWIVSSLLLMGLIGCETDGSRAGDTVFLDTSTEPDTEPDTETDTFAELCLGAVDIVFVLDVSGSMSNMLSTLENEIGRVWDKVDELSPNEEPHFGLVVFVDDYTLVSAESYDEREEIQADFHAWYNMTSSGGQTQSDLWNQDMPENSLDALFGASTEYPWRMDDDVLRIIIHATDASFREHPEQFANGLPAQHTYHETVDALQDAGIRVATFSDAWDGAGYSHDYDGQPAIPEATGGQVFDLAEVAGPSHGLLPDPNRGLGQKAGDDKSLADAINAFVEGEICEYNPI